MFRRRIRSIALRSAVLSSMRPSFTADWRPSWWSRSALLAFFKLSHTGQAIRACADNYTGALVIGLNVKRLYALTFALGSACVGAAGSMLVLLIDVTPNLGPGYTLLAFVIVITWRRTGIDARRAARRHSDRTDGGDGRTVLHAVGKKHVFVRPAGSGVAVPAAGHSWKGRPMKRSVVCRYFRARLERCFSLLGRMRCSLRRVLLQRLSRHDFHSDFLFRLHRAGVEYSHRAHRYLSLGHAIYVGIGAYTDGGALRPFRHWPWIGLPVAILLSAACGALMGFLAFRFRRRRRLFRHSHDCLLRVRPYRLRSFPDGSAALAGQFLPVANYTPKRSLKPASGNPTMFY